MTPENFNWQRFEHGICLDAPLSDVYYMIGTAAGLSEWFIGEAVYTDQDGVIRDADAPCGTGDHFSWKWKDKDHSLEGTVLDANKENFARFTFGKPFNVSISLSYNEDGRTKFLLEQSFNEMNNVVGEFSYINCCVCWVFFITNLKSVMENGIDLRETVSMDETMVNR